MNDAITWSPTATRVTSGPTHSIGARALVAEDARRRRGQRAVGGRDVGVADAAGADPDDDVGRAGIERA